MTMTTTATQHYYKLFAIPEKSVYFTVTVETTVGIGGVNDQEGQSVVVLEVKRHSIRKDGVKSHVEVWSGVRKDAGELTKKAEEAARKIDTIKKCEKILKEGDSE